MSEPRAGVVQSFRLMQDLRRREWKKFYVSICREEIDLICKTSRLADDLRVISEQLPNGAHVLIVEFARLDKRLLYKALKVREILRLVIDGDTQRASIVWNGREPQVSECLCDCGRLFFRIRSYLQKYRPEPRP